MGILTRAKVRLSLALRGILQRPVKLCYPLDGMVGYFPKSFGQKPPEVHYVNQMVERVRRHFVCFDVGAYIGYYTLLFAKFAQEVHSFEPLPANLKLLKKNVRMNRLDNVTIHDVAVGSGKGRLRICANLGSDSMASAMRSETAACFDARQTDLDSFCAENAVYPDLIKIDVEGCELEVLRGMQQVLTRKKPTLFLEVHSSYLQDAEIDEMIGSLREMSYRVFSWLEDVEPGGHGFWRHMAEVERAKDLRVGATLALPLDEGQGPALPLT